LLGALSRNTRRDAPGAHVCVKVGASCGSYSFNEAAIKSDAIAASDSVERLLFPRAGVITVAATRPGSTRLRGYLLCIGYETVHTGQGQTLRRKQLV